MKPLLQHLRPTVGLGLVLTLPWLPATQVAQAGLPIEALTTVQVPATQSTYTDDNGIIFNFGVEADGVTPGSDVNIESLGVDSNFDGVVDFTIVPGAVADQTNVLRVEAGNAAGVVGNRVRFQYEGTRNPGGGNTINVRGSQLTSVDDVLRSLSVNRGTDNLFLNQGAGPNSVANNIERVDLVWLGGLQAPGAGLLDDIGFVFNERNGNNPYRIAAITAIDGAGFPTAFGPLVDAPVAQYGSGQFDPTAAWQIAQSDVDSTVPNNPDLFVVGGLVNGVMNQGFEGQFHSFQELGVAADQVIFGYSLFGADVPLASTSDELVNLQNFPLNTQDGMSGDTGDHFGGGGSTFVNVAAFQPSIGVAKNAVSVVGTQVTYDFVIENFSLVPVDNLSLIDDFDNTFGAGNYTIVSPPSVQVAPNTANSNVEVDGTFTGSGANTEMLNTAVSQLAAGDSVTIRLTIEIATPLPDPPGPLEAGEYENSATTSGTGPTGDRVTDDSVDGADPDAGGDGNPIDGDGDPTNNTSPTRISLGAPNLALVKRITALIRPSGTTEFTSFVDDTADANDNALDAAGLTPVGVSSVDASNPSDTGDIVEYTIYFLSNGLLPATDSQICDLIPTGSTFVEDGFGASQGIEYQAAGTAAAVAQTNASDADDGSFFSTLTPLPAGNPCADQTNPNGAVIVDLGDVPSTAGSNAGFMRFRIQLN